MNTLLDCCTKVVQMMEKMMHYVCEANATNCNDLEITKCICEYILWVAIVFAITFLAWKIIEQIANGVSVWYKRQCEVEDIERKQTAELKKKLMDFLEKNTAPGRYIEDKDKTVNELKEFDSKESQYYISVIKAFIYKEPFPNEPLPSPKTDNSANSEPTS